jgi:UPF0755 protein
MPMAKRTSWFNFFNRIPWMTAVSRCGGMLNSWRDRVDTAKATRIYRQNLGLYTRGIELLILLILVGCCWLGTKTFVDNALTPVSAYTHSVKNSIVTIQKGSSLREIGDLLQSDDMITSSSFFVFYAQWTGVGKKIEAGSYRLSNSMSMRDILGRIVGGDVLQYRVVIPEGFTTGQIGELLVSKGIVTAADWQNALQTESFDYPFLSGAPAGPKRLEGFLFPATYDLMANFTSQEILQVMLNRFNVAFTPEMQQMAKQDGMSLRQVVTLASIVQGEGKLDSERPIIASVFLNRLQRGMRLESNVTVEYALGMHKDELTLKDVQMPSPYNTYLHAGLPPGPICSPGLASIEAVLYPAKTDYLYFMGKGDGSHVFSATWAQQLAAEKKYGQ